MFVTACGGGGMVPGRGGSAIPTEGSGGNAGGGGIKTACCGGGEAGSGFFSTCGIVAGGVGFCST